MVKRNFKKENGVTLIALVVTIIVLLILAGVSIAMLTGENGILTQARNAKEKTENAEKEEDTTINQYESYINRETNTEAVVGEIVTGGNKLYTNNGTAVIPEGFAIVPGFDNVEEGLVISDVENDTGNIGNQFVWVPVENFNDFVRYDFGSQGIKEEDFINTEPTDNKYYEPRADGISTGTEVEDLYKSVKDNKGFYIGRYEAGNDGLDNVICKKGVNVYNNIGWNDDGKVETETGGAVEKARKFSVQNNYTNVISTLIYGVQWDAVMRWLYNGTEEERLWLTDSTGKGNYYDKDNTNNPAKTGVNDNYQMKHIYDLAGNVHEWTMEMGSSSGRVRRGGYYDFGGISTPCSHRGNINADYSTNNVGFRLALYIK